MPDSLLVIACGALAREINALRMRYGLEHLQLVAIDARLHNRPDAIPERLRNTIRRHRGRAQRIFVAYADCGTGGLLQRVCAEEGVERLDGAHCYQFFATTERFTEIQDAEIGSFYLTDFLVRHFERMVWNGLGLDRHPELLTDYFGNYTRLVYLAQTDDPELLRAAETAAERLGLTMIVERTGYGELEPAMVRLKRDR